MNKKGLINAYRMNLIVAESISLDSTFNNDTGSTFIISCINLSEKDHSKVWNKAKVPGIRKQ